MYNIQLLLIRPSVNMHSDDPISNLVIFYRDPVVVVDDFELLFVCLFFFLFVEDFIVKFVKCIKLKLIFQYCSSQVKFTQIAYNNDNF